MKLPQYLLIAVTGLILARPFPGGAGTFFTVSNATADAFLARGSAANPGGADLTGTNFGAVGTLAIAPATSGKGEYDSLIKFNVAGAVSQFNTTYGAGNWAITGLTLSLASSFGVNGATPGNSLFNSISGGGFGIDWLANDNWVEGTGGGAGTAGFPANNFVTFNSISNLFSGGFASLGGYVYTPPGNNIYENYQLPLDGSLVADAAAGGDVSLYFFATDSQINYLINSRTFASAHPELILTADTVPEPVGMALLGLSLVSLVASRRLRSVG